MGSEINPRAVRGAAQMYKVAKGVLAVGISFSKAEHEHKLTVRLRELEQRMKEQIDASCATAMSIREIDRRATRVAALYKDELEEIKKEIDQLTNDKSNDGSEP